jgi:polyphenol oxidase
MPKIDKNNILKKFKNISYSFTNRAGGLSKNNYSSFNLAFHVDDDFADVDANHTILAKKLNYEKETLVHMKQIHSNDVHIVNESDNYKNPPTCDALITNKKNIPLMVMVADCSPILFYDDVQKVIAVAHAGRKGAFSNIVHNVVDSFIQNFNSKAKDIYVSIGASICSLCYEVGEEIAKEAKVLNLEYAIETHHNRYHLNIRKILKHQLLESGIQEKNIEISDECSSCLDEKYFSYRSHGVTGRFAGVIKLN